MFDDIRKCGSVASGGGTPRERRRRGKSGQPRNGRTDNHNETWSRR